MPKSTKDEMKNKYKEYEESVIKINTENFEILVDKLKTAMTSKKGHNNFILNAQNCTFDNFYGKDENGNKISEYEYTITFGKVQDSDVTMDNN